MKLSKEQERLLMVKAMEYICRQINDEDVFLGWLMNGVADGDIEYGDFSAQDPEADEVSFYTDDESFADLMATFLRRMRRACQSGGLYCGGVISNDLN